MTMNASEANYDLVLTGAQICDPATGLDRTCDLAVTGDRIAAVGSGLASRARQVIELDGKLATAGWIDLHVHVFEWMTTFGLPPDDAGVHSGKFRRHGQAGCALARRPWGRRPGVVTGGTGRRAPSQRRPGWLWHAK